MFDFCRSVFPTRKSRENYTKNAKRRNARKPAKVAKKLFAFKPSDTFQKGLPVILYANSLFVTFASENPPANFNKKDGEFFTPDKA